MNHFHNQSARKFVSPPKKVADLNFITENNQKKGKQETRTREKLDRTKPSEALKIFYESENFSVNEPFFDYDIKKKSSRGISFQNFTEEKKKSRKNWKALEKQEIFTDSNLKKPNYLAIIESQLAKTRAVAAKKSHCKSDIKVSNDSLSANELAKTQEIIVAGTEFEKVPFNSLFSIPKPSADPAKKIEKSEVALKAKGSSLSSCQNLSRKDSEKVSNKAQDVKTTISDCGKRHINEILKSHAQKVQSTQVKTFMKDYSIQEVSDIIKNVRNLSSTSGVKVDKGTQQKNAAVKNDKKESKLEVKVSDKGVRDSKKTKDSISEEKKKPSVTWKIKDNTNNENNVEEKKKLPGTWLSVPRSNELERRLKPNGQEPGSLFLKNEVSKVDENLEGDGKSQKSETDQEKLSEKRITYIDRLLLLKMVGKNLEDKKQKTLEANHQSEEINKQTKKVPIKENQESLAKKIESLFSHQPRVSLSSTPASEDISPDTKELVFLKQLTDDTEQALKTKQTRSTELRDLVSQAIKEHKIFCIFDNHSYIVRPVREELLSRGWLEVIPDRRLIPRRRPPPTGPTYERDKAAAERNCNVLEAILTAKETFADELQATVSRSQSFRFTLEKPKPAATAITSAASKKCSEESLNEVLSQFRIIPPTAEKKKNNTEIREFMGKYQAIMEKEKEKQAENQKKEKNKLSLPSSSQKSKSEDKPKSSSDSTTRFLTNSKSIREILQSINSNKEVIMHAALELKGFDEKTGAKSAIGVLFESTAKTAPAIKETNETLVKPSTQGAKIFFSDSEARAISKIIQSSNARIHFMWLSIKPAIHLKCFNYSPEIINKFQKTTFCTKIGLWSHLNNIQWYAHEVNYPAKSPRMYNTGEADDLQAFFQDFHLTACIGMLKWLSDTFFERGLKAVQTKKGKVPLKAFEFAIKQCERYIRFKENEDLTIHEEPKVHEDEWNTFLQWFYMITNDHGRVQESSSAQLMVVYTKAVETLKAMRRHWPEIDIDGRLNIWIMKPYCASCGRGIFMTNNVYYIGQHSKYIVQKYIERPFLIYNTKFDIRQWFMITKLTPLEIWMYKECYLRFCTQPFALRNLHESVHLSNNSVQKKYISYRDPSLPDQNMWDSNTFQLYLKTIGHPNTWDDIIYPGMKDAIVSTMLAAQDTFDGPRKSWFEVYGADFMLSANLKEGPWLIEINENPAMDPSTKVTARLCPQMLRDVIKVVVDKRANKNASTGQWELIYRQNYSPSFSIVDLDVRGKKILRVPHSTKVSFNGPPLTSTFPTDVKKPTTLAFGFPTISEIVKDQKAALHIGCVNDFEKLRNEKKFPQNAKVNGRISN